MGAPDPDDIDCVDALRRVFLFLDGEIGPNDAAQARHHIAECAPCLREYGLEEEVKRLVYRSCHNELAPAEFRTKIQICIQRMRLELEP
jgi:mycothiol system anti-sigma-R factor